MRVLTKLLLTVGGLGLSPIAPGSLGALPAIGVAWLLIDAHWSTWAALCWFLTVVGISLSDSYLRTIEGAERVHRRTVERHDPQEIVIDEFIGCLIALAFVPWSWPWVLAAYTLFRILDMTKPGPIGWLARNGSQGLGVIGDDVLAGLVAGLALYGFRQAAAVL